MRRFDTVAVAVGRNASLIVKLTPLQQVDRTCVRWQGRKLIYFSGCDYFRMASHPAVLKAVADGLRKFGLNVAASRLTTGHHQIYDALEASLADFFGAEDALLVSNGYLTNTIVAQALAGNFSHALMDEKTHPALLDASVHLDCPILKFKHRDAEAFAGAIKRCGPGARPIVLTDGMFSHDGSVPPLKAYLKTLPPDALILVDDAHGGGVLGKNGRGALELERVSRRQIIQCCTLSKAIGVYGGAILGTRELREKILARGRAFIGSTPLPLPLANAALTAIGILKQRGKALRERMHRNADFVKDGFRKVGFEIPDAPGPIVPIHPKTEADTAKLNLQLLKAGIYPPFLTYGGTKGYFRFVISSEHTKEQLEKLIQAVQLAVETMATRL